ncbi:MAG: nitroreductase family protein [Ancrocorticia sp.]|uniref:nitroreductase family protein n=1 Tax=Ancrocorticia sp. TaxID=2593684 RepID=UPI003F926396
MAVPAIRKSFDSTQRAFLELFGSSRLGATIYSIPGLLTFNREQYAVLSGRRAYYKNMGQPRATHVELRRNVHRLEKGLIMEPRREVFAKDYILETVEFYRDATKPSEVGPTLDPAEARWARDVLDAYFAAVEHTDPTITKALAVYNDSAMPLMEELDRRTSPYAHGEVGANPVSFDDLLALAKRRRSVRWFESKPVPRDLLDQAFRVAREAPTACNREPFEFLVFDDPEKAREIAGVPFGTGGYSEQLPVVIVVKGKLDSYFSPRDRHAPYVDASLASMQFILAAETLGLGTVVINWPDFEPLEAKMAKKLGLKPHERVLFLMGVGYPREDGKVPSSVKKSLSVLRTYNAEVQ